jgi:hypothetical protein
MWRAADIYRASITRAADEGVLCHVLAIRPSASDGSACPLTENAAREHTCWHQEETNYHVTRLRSGLSSAIRSIHSKE